MNSRSISRSLLLILAVAGCDRIPSDPEGTSERVRAERSFRVGLISSGDRRDGRGLEQALIRRVAAAAGARPAVSEGASEPLLLALEEGELDLVIGLVSPETPWAERVAILRPLGQTIDGRPRLLLAPIARHGENRWIMLLEREARAVAAGAAK